MKIYSMNCNVYLIFYVHNFMRVKNIYTTLICY